MNGKAGNNAVAAARNTNAAFGEISLGKAQFASGSKSFDLEMKVSRMKTGELLVHALEQITNVLKKTEARSAGPSPIVVKDKHTIFDSLYRRIEKITYEADNDRTFDGWHKRFKNVFDNDCGDLDDKEKTRLLVSGLDEDCHQLFCGSIYAFRSNMRRGHRHSGAPIWIGKDAASTPFRVLQDPVRAPGLQRL
ncbi:unnamed protein product [Heligmosomoides polygyrus]|uniref:DUF7083 domain-containing protein n=1 Tax=Heligmosomoides polygyrus TaxID=6339 RepID=A0A183GKT4_HELPZ|nr:unnamed protein product [Heligmosomoides polygyrus]